MSEGVDAGTDASPGSVRSEGLIRRGSIATWIVFLALWLFVDVSTLDAILLALILGALPAFSVAQVPLVGDEPIERLPAYWASIVLLWLLGTASYLVGARQGGAASVGLVWSGAVHFVVWLAILTASAFAIVLTFRWVAMRLGLSESPLLHQLLPRTRQERATFGLLSVAAGFGEELAFRGYAILTLTPALGVAASAALSTLAFALVHAYQGRLGVLRTGLMGGVFAWGLFASGSLWPAIAAHALFDVLAGIVLGERLMPRPTEDRAPPPP